MEQGEPALSLIAFGQTDQPPGRDLRDTPKPGDAGLYYIADLP